MSSLPRNLASALAVSTACGALAAAVFIVATAALPRPATVAGVFSHRDAPVLRAEGALPHTDE